jgi:hypothetical protein
MAKHGLSVLGVLCLSYLVWRPVSTPLILYPVLALLAVVSLVQVGVTTRIAKPFACSVILIACAGAFAALNGAMHGTPGLVHQSIVWFGGLLLWSTWAAALRRETIRMTLIAITLATALLSAFIALFVGGQTGILPQLLPDSLLQAQEAGFHDTPEGSAIRLYGLSSLVIAGPLVTAGLLAGKDRLLPPRSLMAIAGILAILAALVAGRRALAIVIVLSPVLAYIFARALRPRLDRTAKQSSHISVLVIAAPLVLLSALWAFRDTVSARILNSVSEALAVYFGVGEIYASTKSPSDIDRIAQIEHLLTEWREHPFTGKGMGAVLRSGFYRSSDRPWLFELQYHQLLFSFGLIGMTFLFGAVAAMWICVRSAAAQHPEHVPTIVVACVAASSLLIANASNPYLQAVGHGWGVALLAGIANALLRPAEGPSELVARSRGPQVFVLHRLPLEVHSDK